MTRWPILVGIALAVSGGLVPAHAAPLPRAAQADTAAFPAPDAPPPPSSSYFGAILTTNSPGWQAVLPRPETSGALVLAVLPDSPAEGAGIAAGDVLVAIDDEPVRDDEQASVRFRSSSTEQRFITWAEEGGTAHSASVRLAPPQPNAINEYLRRRVVASPDPVTRALYAQVAADSSVALAIASQLEQETPSFAIGHATLAVVTDRVARERAGPQGELNPEEVAAIEQSITRAIDLDPGSPVVHAIAAKLFLDLGKPDRTEAEAQRAVQINPSSAQAHELLAVARLALRRPAEALPEAHRAVELNPYNGDYYQALLETYLALNDTGRASKTRDALASLTEGPAERGRDVASWRLRLGLTCAGALLAGTMVGLLARRRTAGREPEPGEREQGEPAWPALNWQLGLLEILAAAGAWVVLVPLAGPLFGFEPNRPIDTELVSLSLPGLIVVVISGFGARRWRRNGRASEAWALVPAAVFLCGLWMTGAQIPMARDVLAQRVRVDSGLFYCLPGPTIMALAAWLYVVVTKGQVRRAAEIEEPRPLGAAAVPG